MNEIEFMTECSKDPTWEHNNVNLISMDFIHGSEENLSQVRQGGIDNANLLKIYESIATHGQKIPITIEDSGVKNEKGQTVYNLVDGGHRYLAIKKLRKKNPNRFSVIRAYKQQFSSSWSRRIYQNGGNDHQLPAKANTNNDQTHFLHEVVHVGIAGAPAKIASLLNSSGRNMTDPKRYKNDLKSALKLGYPNISSREQNRVVDQFLKKLPGKFKTWDTDRVTDDFYDWVENSQVTLPAKHQLIMIREPNHVMHSAAGNSLSATLAKEMSDCNTIAIVWSNRTDGKTVSDLNEARLDTIRRINLLNSHDKIKRGKKLINRVFIAPQKLEAKTLETGFYEVLENKNNKRFTVNIHASGWTA